MTAMQLDTIRGVLADRGWHSTLEFVELGILPPAARMHELRRAGVAIETRRLGRPELSAVVEYRLVDVAARVAEVVSPMGDIGNERQPCELAPLLELECMSCSRMGVRFVEGDLLCDACREAA